MSEDKKFEAIVEVERMEDVMVLRTDVGDGEIDGVKFHLSLSTGGSLMVEFGSVYYVLKPGSFIKACLILERENGKGGEDG